MNIAAIFLAVVAIAAFVAIVEIIVFYWLDKTRGEEELFENKYRDPYNLD